MSELSPDERDKKRKKGLKEATPTKAYNKKLELNRKEGQTEERHAEHLKSNQKQGQTQKRLATKKTSDTTFNKEKRKRNKATKEEGSSAKRDNESKVNYDARLSH